MNGNYQERRCKNCGGGKFINHSWGIECWYCGSEYEREEKNVSGPHIRRYPDNSFFTATYFAPGFDYHPYREGRYWP